MKRTTIDILKAIGMTLSGVLIGFVLFQSLKWLANQASVDPIYIVAALIFSVVVYANYQLIKLSK